VKPPIDSVVTSRLPQCENFRTPLFFLVLFCLPLVFLGGGGCLSRSRESSTRLRWNVAEKNAMYWRDPAAFRKSYPLIFEGTVLSWTPINPLEYRPNAVEEGDVVLKVRIDKLLHGDAKARTFEVIVRDWVLATAVSGPVPYFGEGQYVFFCDGPSLMRVGKVAMCYKDWHDDWQKRLEGRPQEFQR